MFKGFRDFLFRGNVVELAVAVVIGAAFNDVVNGFIAAFIDPLLVMALSATGAANLAEATVGAFPIGVFLSAVISFLVKAFVVYFFIVRPFANLASQLAAATPPAPDVQLLTEIRDELKRQNGSLKSQRVAGD